MTTPEPFGDGQDTLAIETAFAMDKMLEVAKEFPSIQP